MNKQQQQKAFQQYNKNRIITASPGELVLFLYEGCIKFCNIAKTAIEKKDYYETNENLKKAQAIIRELQCTLNFDYKVANDFNNIYNYLLPRLIEANIKKDINILEECLEHLRTLKDTWKKIMRINKEKKNT